MEKFKQLQKIKEIYSKGENIIQYLKSSEPKNGSNTAEDIMISYDFQAGTYIKGFSENRAYNDNYCKALASVISNLGDINSMVEVGVGEATTLNTVIRNLKNKPSDILGFDISWSRLKFAKELLKDFNLSEVRLFTADLFEIPLLESSVDVVYTSHSIEPNGGKEEEALKELYRITKKYLVLLEPSFEFASPEAQKRMEHNGYVTKLHSTAKKLNYKIVEHRLFDFSSNPLNPSGLMIIEKKSATEKSSDLVCPISFSELVKVNPSLLYSNESFLAYPIVDEIPCLLGDNAILATHLLTDYKKFKTDNNIKNE